jgi:hypothetical protein
MKKTWQLVSSAFAVATALAIGMNHQAHATVSGQEGDFEVRPVLSDGQADTTVNYFDLDFKKGSTNTIRMQVYNNNDHTLKIKTAVRSAYTQNGGDLQFANNAKSFGAFGKIQLSDIAKVVKKDREFSIGPGETKYVQATVKMPKNNYSGLVYGDWYFIQKQKKAKSKSTGVAGNYAYSVGIALRGKNYEVHPELKYKTTGPILYNRHPAMGIKINNVKPMILTNTQIKAVIIRKGFNESKRMFNATGAKIAPDSTLTIPINWGYDQMKSGTYKVKVQIVGHSHVNNLPMTWNFTKSFKVSNKQAKSINTQAVKKPVNKWTYVATASGILTLVLAGTSVWIVRKHA